jgi:NTP pyrophosphatase (non-canonical NTP hydrolase)
MTFKEYQEAARKTAIYPNIGQNYIYPTLGLTGEAGEVAEKIKKILRAGIVTMDQEQTQGIAKELGDVLWYLAHLATELGLDLDQIANANLEKLASRQQRDVLQGSGDNR